MLNNQPQEDEEVRGSGAAPGLTVHHEQLVLVLLLDHVEPHRARGEVPHLAGVLAGVLSSHHRDGEGGGEAGQDVRHGQGHLRPPVTVLHSVGQAAVGPSIWRTVSEIEIDEDE